MPLGSRLVMEFYADEQLSYGTGGPRDRSMLMSVAKISAAFPDFEPLLLRSIERDVIEGSLHTGRSAVIQFVGQKKSAK